jgi:hypothetical protein
MWYLFRSWADRYIRRDREPSMFRRREEFIAVLANLLERCEAPLLECHPAQPLEGPRNLAWMHQQAKRETKVAPVN